MDIAVIGDQELVSALKLAGIRKTRVIQSDRSAAADIRKALDEYTNDPDVGVIVVLEEFTEMAGQDWRRCAVARESFPSLWKCHPNEERGIPT